MRERVRPTHPRQPRPISINTAIEARDFAEKMTRWETEMREYNMQQVADNHVRTALHELWHKKLRREYKELPSEVYEIVLSYCVEKCSSYSGIRDYMDDIAPMPKTFSR